MRVEGSITPGGSLPAVPGKAVPGLPQGAAAEAADPDRAHAGNRSPVQKEQQEEERSPSVLARQPLAELLREEGYDISFQLSFTFHKETKELIVKVLDPDTGKVIREIPPEELLELAMRIQEMVGLLIDKRV